MPYYSSYGCSVCCGGVYASPTTPTVIELPKSEMVPVPATKTSRITVTVPAEARLWVDNVECPLASTTRTFTTPALNPGQQYFYNMKIEVARDGRTVTETQRVLITPGQESRVDFNKVGSLATAAR